MIAGLQQAADCQELRRLAAGQCQRPDTALKRCDAFFEHRRRGVHDACVDVPEALQRKQFRSVPAVFKNI